jgi:6-phosphofructokinase 1
VAAAALVRRAQWGSMVGLEQGRMAPLPLGEVAGRTRHVPLGHALLRCARDTGVSLGVA